MAQRRKLPSNTRLDRLKYWSNLSRNTKEIMIADECGQIETLERLDPTVLPAHGCSTSVWVDYRVPKVIHFDEYYITQCSTNGRRSERTL